MPLTVRYRAHAPKVPPNSRTKLQHPSPDRLVADLQPALPQQIFNIEVAQGEAQVEPNRVPDHIRREAVAGVGKSFACLRVAPSNRRAANYRVNARSPAGLAAKVVSQTTVVLSFGSAHPFLFTSVGGAIGAGLRGAAATASGRACTLLPSRRLTGGLRVTLAPPFIPAFTSEPVHKSPFTLTFPL